MKVVFVAPYALPFRAGGFESQVYNIFSELKKIGVNVSWHNFEDSNLDGVDILQVMATDSSMIPMMKKAKSKGVKIVMTPMQGSRAKTNRHYKRCLFLSKIPQFCTGHLMNFEAINCADYLTPLCSYEANRLIEVFRFKKESITIIPNGIDFAFLDDRIIDVDLPFKDYLLIVGRIEKNKNQFTLIEVAKQLKKKLIVVGESGNENEGYLEKCKSIANEDFFFWGMERNPLVLKTIYRKAALTVIPSFSEMVPLVAFESLSQKTPVVCTNHCGIADDSIPGLLFSDIGKTALAKSVIKMFDYNRELITRQGIFTWTDIARMYKEVYEKLLG